MYLNALPVITNNQEISIIIIMSGETQQQQQQVTQQQETATTTTTTAEVVVAVIIITTDLCSNTTTTDIFTPLALRIFLCKNSDGAPLEVVRMVGKELFETLTIRSLLHLCTACKQSPTPAMLAVALQNSIPSLTGLPTDNPDVGFYVDIARRFFAPASIPISRRTNMYSMLVPGRLFGHLVNRDSLETQHGDFSSGISCYIHLILHSCELVHTKKGRDFIKSIVLEWLQTPDLCPDMVKVYSYLVNVLDHGLVLHRRNLVPGGIGRNT